MMGQTLFTISEFIPDPDTKFKFMVGLLYFISMIFSSFISNTAIGVVMTPIAISVAETWMVDPRPFLIAVCFGASASFMTPMGYQTNLMVFGPGQYKFSDFMKAGLPLSFIYWVVAMYAIPKFWPFYSIEHIAGDL